MRLLAVALLTVAACASPGETGPEPVPDPAPESPDTVRATATTTTIIESPSTTGPTSSVPVSVVETTTTGPPLGYVFPFGGRDVSYGRGHHDYPAVDVFGCGATVVAPVRGSVAEIRTVDLWPGSGNNPAYRGGLYVSLIGDDGVRYYFAHLAGVEVVPGQVVSEGTPLGVMGETGNAAQSACHTHFGISWPCEGREWAVRRGKVWPQDFLDAWRSGNQVSPREAVELVRSTEPDACATAMADPDAPSA